MKLSSILVTLFLAIATNCFAETIQVDVSAWTQDQKNGATVAVLRVLNDAGITHQGVQVSLPNIEVLNPSLPVNSVLTQSAIEAEYQQWMDEVAIATAAEQAKYQAMRTEMSTHDMRKITLADIDSRIDGISNLAGAKAFLKKLTHYLWAKGYFETNE